MSSSNKSDATATIGTVLEQSGQRDAIHVAVISVVAAEKLYAGQHVGFLHDNTVGLEGKAIGIVDPFLDGYVKKGQSFWLAIYPRTITGLRHVWTHPDIPDDTPTEELVLSKTESELWLRNFVDRSDCPDYNTLISALKGEWPGNNNEDGYANFGWNNECLHFGSVDAHGSIPPEFWDHVSVVLGRVIEPGKRAEYFSCSC